MRKQWGTDVQHTDDGTAAVRRDAPGRWGAAIAIVSLLGTALVMLAAVAVTASVQSYQRTSSDRSFEEAIVVAESGVDRVLYEINEDQDFMALNGLEVSADLSTRAAVIEAAEEVADLDAAAVIETPDGEVVVIKPEDELTVYAVGFSPSRDAERRRERVMEVEYELEYVVTPNWTADMAFVTGGDLDLDSASAGVVDGTGSGQAHVHANGEIPPRHTVE